MMQRLILEKMLERGGREVGFLARYLLVQPPEEALFGNSRYTPPVDGMPARERFDRRARELLELKLPVDDKFNLKPPVMMASKDALRIFSDYHDRVEVETGRFGEFETVRDIARKSPEQAARIAAVFQIFDRGPGGELLPEYMEAGVKVATWHLLESVRIFSEIAKPEHIQDAETLAAWLANVAPTLKRGDGTGSPLVQNGCLPKGEIGRQGPGCLRGAKGRERRQRALIELAADDVNHVRETKIGAREVIEINPNLLKS